MSDILKGLVKGLSGFGLIPQDDPDVKIFNTQGALKDIAAKEEAVFAHLGRRVYESLGGEEYPEIREELERIKAEKRAAEETLRLAQEEKAARERAKAEAEAEAEENARSCPNCGSTNPVGTNFCQECGTKLATPVSEGKRFCSNCGASIDAGSQFCTSCGTRVGQ